MNTATSADHDKAFGIIRDIQLIDLNYRDAQFVRAELADAIAAAVQAEREANETALRNMATTAHTEIGFVGAANYPERQREAHNRVDTALDKQLAAIRARSNGNGSK